MDRQSTLQSVVIMKQAKQISVHIRWDTWDSFFFLLLKECVVPFGWAVTLIVFVGWFCIGIHIMFFRLIFCLAIQLQSGPLFISRRTYYRKISKPQHSDLSFSNRSEIRQTPRQQRCRDACPIAERYDHGNTHFRAFETSRDFGVKTS